MGRNKSESAISVLVLVMNYTQRRLKRKLIEFILRVYDLIISVILMIILSKSFVMQSHVPKTFPGTPGLNGAIVLKDVEMVSGLV